MFGEIIQSPFANNGIIKTMALINDKYFTATADFFLNAPNTGFLTEEMLKDNIDDDPEKQILYWLWRVQRYFLIEQSGKSGTVECVMDLLKNLAGLPEPIAKFLCVDPIALNILLFSLLLCQDKIIWESVLNEIRNYNKSPSLLLLLDWCYDFYFSIQALNSCETILDQLNNTCEHPDQFKLPDSPLSTLFKFIALTQWYAINPLSQPAPYLVSVLPEEEGLKLLSIVSYTIDLGIVSEYFSNHAHACTSSLDIPAMQLLAHFGTSGLTKIQLLSELNRKPFEAFLNHFLPFYLDRLNKINQLEHLGGLAQLIRFYNFKPLDLYCNIYQNGILLVKKLFCLEQYTEAYELYDELTCFYTGNDKKSLVIARSALYGFASNIHKWVNGEEQKPHFNDMELAIIPKIKLLKEALGEKEIPNNQLYLLAKGLGLKFQRSKDFLIRSQCENYYSLISEYLTTIQKKELHSLFSAPKIVPEKHSKNKSNTISPNALAKSKTKPEDRAVIAFEPKTVKELRPKLKSQNRPKIVHQASSKSVSQVKSGFVPQTKPNFEHQNKSKLKEIVPSLSSSIHESTTPDSVMSSFQLTDKKHQNSLKTCSNITFFPPQPLNVVEKNKFITRSKLPHQIIQLLDALRLHLPDIRIYLTGAAPSNILDGVEPNDHDILILNTNIYRVNELLQSWNLRTEIRSSKFPIIFCDLGKGITLDFSVKYLYPNDIIEQVLEKDFSERDFNLNALYCEITEEDSFRVFSFEKAIEARDKKVIVSIQNPEHSFKYDPTRIFRLAKLLIANPDYQLGDELAEYIQKFQLNWSDILNQFIRLEKGNRDRLTFAIRKLFVRYNYQEINIALFKLNVLTEFTGNSQASVQEACSKIQYAEPENKLVYWMLANILQGYEEGKKLCEYPLYPFLRLFPQEVFCMHSVHNLVHGKPFPFNLCPPGVHLLIAQFKLDNKEENEGCLPPQYVGF